MRGRCKSTQVNFHAFLETTKEDLVGDITVLRLKSECIFSIRDKFITLAPFSQTKHLQDVRCDTTNPDKLRELNT